MAAMTPGAGSWVGRLVAVGALAVTGLFWLLGLFSGVWAVRQLGPAALGNRCVVFGQAAGPWFGAAGLLTVALAVVYAIDRASRPAPSSPR